MITPYTEEILVLHLRQGNRKAFQHLYSNYRESLLRVISTVIKDPDQADDLLQDTYVKIWQRFSRYDASQGGLFNWMLNIARNTAIDAIRRRNKATELLVYVESDIQPMALCWVPAVDSIGLKQLVKQMLLPQQWQVIDLVYWHGYTFIQIADQLVLPLGTVKSRARQSLIRLRPLFRS